MDKCKICDREFATSQDDAIILCEYKGGFVHLGCCINNCSLNKEPCKHCKGLYEKI